jgi:hypothetical protein
VLIVLKHNSSNAPPITGEAGVGFPLVTVRVQTPASEPTRPLI